MSKTSWIIIIIVVALAAVAGIYYFTQQSQQPATGPAPSIPAELQPMAEKAAGIAATTFHVKPEEVTVLSIQSVTWPDASLGCPEEGMMYSQKEMSGYLATVEVSGATHSVHMSETGQGLVCPPDRAQPPVENK